MKFFNKISSSSQQDLTPLIVIARRGLRRDVQHLCDALPSGKLFAALASSVEGIPNEREVTLRKGTKFIVHVLPHPTNTAKTLSALFTKEEFFASMQKTSGWTTDGGPLRFLSLGAKDALELVRQAIDAGQSFGLVINPYQESVLELLPEEVRSLAQGEPLPFIHYVRNVPVQQGETFLVGKPAVPPPAELVETVEKYTASHPQINGYKLVQIFNPERDVEPHLVLNILTMIGEAEHQEISREISLAITGKIPPPGYIDIVFNTKLGQ